MANSILIYLELCLTRIQKKQEFHFVKQTVIVIDYSLNIAL